MKDLINILIKLQEVDKRIFETHSFLEKVPKRLHEVDGPLKQAQTELEKMKQKTEALAKKKKDKEKLLEEVHEKIKKMKARSSDIKTNKEYQAHLKEIEASEAGISDIEEQILVVMEELDIVLKEQKKRDQEVKAEEAKIMAFKQELDGEADRIGKELSQLKEERSGMVGLIEPVIYKQYMKLLRSSNGVAVTGTKNEICLGCNMNIPPQLFVEIRKNEEVIQCPQCGRILYYQEDATVS